LPARAAIVACLLILGFATSCSERGAKGRLVETVELQYRFHPVTRVMVGEPVEIKLQLQSTAPLPRDAVRLHYEEDGQWNELALQPEGAGLYLVSLGPRERGARIRYYLTIRTPAGTLIALPKGAPEKGMYEVVVHGQVHPILLTAHVVLIVAALLTWIGAALVARRVALKTGSVRRATFLATLGLVAFVIGAFPIGMLMEYTAHGRLWSGWPFGSDGTEMNAVWVLLYWLLVLFVLRRRTEPVAVPGSWKTRVLERLYCWAVIAGAMLAAILFWNPHGTWF